MRDDMAVRPWNVLSFCAGVGGLELGICIAEPGSCGVAYVEREAAAAASLVASMEAGWFHPAPVWSDAGTFDGRPWRGVVHCIASGDPCQPNSVAGRGLGNADDRWLIGQLLRCVDECRPDRLFRENVPGNADGQLAALVGPLEGMGYRVASGIFSAAEVGASHRRERLFIMADRDDAEWADEQVTVGGRGGSPDLGRSRAPLAIAERCDGDARADGPRISQGCGADDQLGRSGQPMDDAQRPERWAHCQPCDGEGPDAVARRRHEGAARAGASGEAVGNPSRIGRGEGQPEPELWSGRDATSSNGGTMADAELRRSQDQSGLAAQGRQPDTRDGGMPAFAPGPADPRWPAILARAPQLEPAVRRVAHGVAGRIERLRACGNGVFPLAAANAWVRLGATLAADRAARAAAVKVAA